MAMVIPLPAAAAAFLAANVSVELATRALEAVRTVAGVARSAELHAAAGFINSQLSGAEATRARR